MTASSARSLPTRRFGCRCLSHWLLTATLLPTLGQFTAARADDYDSCKIEGVVTDDAGTPLTGAVVSVNRFQGAEPASENTYNATANNEGRYAISVRFKKGRTLLLRELFADARGYVRGAPDLKTELANGEKTTVDFRLQKGAILAGTINLPITVFERRIPREKIVRVLEVSNPDFDKYTINARCHLFGADGKFEIYVPAGTYTLRVVNYEFPVEWKGIAAPKDDLALEMPPFEWNEANMAEAFDHLWEVLDYNYSYFTLKPDVNWQALRDEHRPAALKARNAAELAAAIRPMLAALNDMHVWIETPTGIVPCSQPSPYVYNGNREITLGQLTETTKCGKFAIVGKTKSDGFGYFLMTRQSNATPADVKKAVAAIRALADVPGFIIDLRSANGGSEPLAAEIAREFCPAPTVYAKSKYRNGEKHDVFGQSHDRVLPASDDAYTRPVVCLIGPGAVSSGEGFVKMMRCLPHVTTVGLPTRGASGNPKPCPLSRTGLTVFYSSWVDMLPDGQSFEGVGIPPAVRVEAPRENYTSDDPTLNKGLEVLRAKVAEKK